MSNTDDEIRAEIAKVELFERLALEDFEIVRERFLGDKQRIEDLRQLFIGWKPIRDEVIAFMRDGNKAAAARITRQKGAQYVADLASRIKGLTEFADGKASEFLSVAQTESQVAVYFMAIAASCLLLVSIGMTYVMTRCIVRPVNAAVNSANSIAAGNLETQISIDSNDEVGKLLKALKDMQHQLKEREEEKERGANEENSRIRQALDQVSSCVVVADKAGHFSYCNDAAKQLFNRAENEIRIQITQFSPDDFGSLKIDHFNVDAKSAISGDMTTENVVQFGKYTFHSCCGPVTSAEGEFLGFVMQIVDQTEQLQIEQEVQSVVEAVLAGDLSARVDLKNKFGFFATLSERVNTLVELNYSVVSAVQNALQGIVSGNLDRRMSGEFKGTFGELQNSVNETQVQLKDIIDQVQKSARFMSLYAEKLIGVNVQLAESSETSAKQADLATTNATDVSSKIGSIATATLEMTTSTKRISKNTLEAAEVAQRAIGLTTVTEDTVRKLNTSSTNIGSISNVITSIAEQTNLLALNATIEAARAGDAGKGFAVVANEVKELAKETAKATEKIQTSIQGIQGDSHEAQEAISTISSTIGIIGELQEVTSSAVIEQESVANEISLSIGEAANSSNDITEQVSDVAGCAKETQTALSEVKELADNLFKVSEDLEDTIAIFNQSEARNVAKAA